MTTKRENRGTPTIICRITVLVTEMRESVFFLILILIFFLYSFFFFLGRFSLLLNKHLISSEPVFFLPLCVSILFF